MVFLVNNLPVVIALVVQAEGDVTVLILHHVQNAFLQGLAVLPVIAELIGHD